jgi:hypothetical protein
MSSIRKELLIVSSIILMSWHMEATTEISISYNSKESSMFSQECVGGSKNGSSKLAWRAARLQSSCTGVHSRTRQRSANALTMNYADNRSDGDEW